MPFLALGDVFVWGAMEVELLQYHCRCRNWSDEGAKLVLVKRLVDNTSIYNKKALKRYTWEDGVKNPAADRIEKAREIMESMTKGNEQIYNAKIESIEKLAKKLKQPSRKQQNRIKTEKRHAKKRLDERNATAAWWFEEQRYDTVYRLLQYDGDAEDNEDDPLHYETENLMVGQDGKIMFKPKDVIAVSDLDDSTLEHAICVGNATIEDTGHESTSTAAASTVAATPLLFATPSSVVTPTPHVAAPLTSAAPTTLAASLPHVAALTGTYAVSAHPIQANQQRTTNRKRIRRPVNGPQGPPAKTRADTELDTTSKVKVAASNVNGGTAETSSTVHIKIVLGKRFAPPTATHGQNHKSTNKKIRTHVQTLDAPYAKPEDKP
ncbi:hypothetical protein BDZ45DRAFT_758586 [Acephala macrosclerotiorum]|nr:hypothetical protein BDZ45DRAFT_758586 [Acephala macrosclerotiorum]